MSSRIDRLQLCPVATVVFDPGNVRLGSGCITSTYPAFEPSRRQLAQHRSPQVDSSAMIDGFPSLQSPKPEIADAGTVRLGSGCITGEFQPR